MLEYLIVGFLFSVGFITVPGRGKMTKFEAALFTILLVFLWPGILGIIVRHYVESICQVDDLGKDEISKATNL